MTDFGGYTTYRVFAILNDPETQIAYWSYHDPTSFTMRFDDVNLFTPSEEHIGEYITNTMIVHAWFEGELVPIAGILLRCQAMIRI